MPTARIEIDGDVVTGEYEDGRVTVDGTTYTAGVDGSLCPPCEPSTVYCFGRNYPSYLEQNEELLEELHGADPPEELHFFLKGATSVIPHEAPIPYPSFTDSLGYAGELAAVIDRRCKHVDPEDVPDVVRGYTILNDVDAKDQNELTEMKVFDGSAPIGPAIADVDPTSLQMRTTIDGEIRQEETTDRMYRPPSEAISALSERVTLRPDDVIAMGSPANPGTVDPGETIEIYYEGIGTLRNTVE